MPRQLPHSGDTPKMVREAMALVGLIGRLFGRGKAGCRETRELSSDYLEGELSSRKRSAIRAHLQRCAPCRAFVETLSTTIGVLARLPRMTPPPGFNQLVIEKAKREGLQ